MSQRHYLLSPSSCYPSRWGFFCPYSSLCQESGQRKLCTQVKNLADFLADYEGDSLARFSHCFFLLSFSSLPTYLPSSPHTYMPTNILTHIPTYLPSYLHTYIPTYLHTYTPTYIPTYLEIFLSPSPELGF